MTVSGRTQKSTGFVQHQVHRLWQRQQLAGTCHLLARRHMPRNVFDRVAIDKDPAALNEDTRLTARHPGGLADETVESHG